MLLPFSRYVHEGMFPNNFPDASGEPEYNTVDAALWYFEAIRQYFAATQDDVTLQKLFPVLATIIDAHVKGTRYNIHVDSADGLLYPVGPRAQPPWQDAKTGDLGGTSTIGKLAEGNALWIKVLDNMDLVAN